MEIFLLLDLRTFSFSQHLNFLLFLPPLLLAITFQFSAIPHGRQTLPLLPFSTCGTSLASLYPTSLKSPPPLCVLLSRGERISPFYFPSQRLNLPVSVVSPPFYAFSLQRQSTYKLCNSENRIRMRHRIQMPYRMQMPHRMQMPCRMQMPYRFMVSLVSPFSLSSSSGWYSFPIDVQATLLRNRLSSP